MHFLALYAFVKDNENLISHNPWKFFSRLATIGISLYARNVMLHRGQRNDRLFDVPCESGSKQFTSTHCSLYSNL